jgi:phospholipid/cholesterol/gamma-HCH transport system substrate-binding protein
VKVTMNISDDVPIPDDVQAAIVPLSLIGERYVQLFPAWTEGQARVADGHTLDLDDTIVPVEPDEALAALKDFLDSLDPDGLGNLVDNIAEDLAGNGDRLNSALGNLSDLVSTFADEDDELLSLVDNFDRFTQTLVTRESQLGQALDAFATAADVLASERGDIETLVAALARVSEEGLDLVAEHSTQLRRDIEIVTKVARSIHANLGAVEDLLDSGPQLIGDEEHGLIGAYNPDARAIDLRQSFSPLIIQILGPLFDSIGVQLPCIPVDVTCEGVLGSAGSAATPATVDQPTTPVDDVLALLGAPAAREDQR